jgi:glycosyltransferase involved in cell wall biosynthesis
MPSSRLKILFLIPTLGRGGAERVVTNLVRNMDRSKFDMTLAILNTDTSVFLDDVPKDINLIVIGSSRVRYAAVKLGQLIRDSQPDIVFSTLGYMNLLIAILRPLLPKRIRFIGRSDAILSLSIQVYKYPKIWEWAYRCFYGRFDRIICQSRYMREDLCKNFGIAPDKMHVINNPVDIDRIRQQAEEPISTDVFDKNRKNGVINLVCVGRLVAIKGFHLLIEAIALSEKNRFHLFLLGEGEEKNALKELAENLCVSEQVSFLGFQNNPYAYLARADAFVLSSLHEGFPNVVLESLACLTPVIATPAPGGTMEILEGLEGCLVAQAISASAISDALNSFTFGQRLSPELVKPYSLGRIVNNYEQEFIDLVADNQTPG